MEQNTANRTIALAALFQSTDGVSKVANTGSFDSAPFEASMQSIVRDSDTIESLFGGLENLETGFKSLIYQLGSNPFGADSSDKNMEITRYAVSLLHLEKKMSQYPDLFTKLLKGIEDTQRQLEHFDITHETIVLHLADIYSNTVSSVGPKVMIKGDQSILANPHNAAKIRALLLAGIRASLLWRQAGGNRWKLLFERSKLQKQAELYLDQIQRS